jgi:uncharacterized protein (TIGR03435 family)
MQRAFALAVILAAGVLCAPAVLLAQQFDAAVVKPAAPSNEPFVHFDVSSGGRLIATNATLRDLIIRAYGVMGFQLEAGPDWMNTARFDITATTAPGANPTAADVNAMLRGLLVDRFALRTRTEERIGPIYALVPVKGDGRLGPSIVRSTLDCTKVVPARTETVKPGEPAALCQPQRLARIDGGVVTMTWKSKGVSLSMLASLLVGTVARPVVDRTLLAGTWDIEFTFSPDRVTIFVDGPAPPTTTTGPAEGLSVHSALRDQLGLKLEADRGPTSMLIVESAQRPSAN